MSKVLQPKPYPRSENVRNRENISLYQRLVKAAFGNCNVVIVGHHIVFQRQDLPTAEENLATVNEIPSADCLLFDLDIMGASFGAQVEEVLREISCLRPGERERFVRDRLDGRQS